MEHRQRSADEVESGINRHVDRQNKGNERTLRSDDSQWLEHVSIFCLISQIEDFKPRLLLAARRLKVTAALAQF